MVLDVVENGTEPLLSFFLPVNPSLPPLCDWQAGTMSYVFVVQFIVIQLSCV